MSEITFQTVMNEPHDSIGLATELFTNDETELRPVVMVGSGYRLYAATKDARLVGAANACLDVSDGLGYIRKIEVDTAYRGQGIGSALLHYTIDDLRAGGQARAAICPINENNRRLYERLGFAKDPDEVLSPGWLFMDLSQPQFLP